MKKNENKKIEWKWTDVVAGVILIMGLLRILDVSDLATRLDNTTLLYLCAAAAVFLLKHASSFKFGDMEINLNQIKEELAETKLLAGIAEDNSKLAYVPERSQETKSFLAETKGVTPGQIPDDPWKGVFGGKNISKEKGRELKAEVNELKDTPGWYSVVLIVSSFPEATQLKGDVQFFLHDSFPNNMPIVKAINGCSTLRLKAWGAFTVGVLADDGDTKLELDLAELSSAPIEFRSN